MQDIIFEPLKWHPVSGAIFIYVNANGFPLPTSHFPLPSSVICHRSLVIGHWSSDIGLLIGQPRTIRNQAFAAMTLLDELFDTCNDLVKNKLDKLMIRFKYTDTKFYSEYERARTIVD